MLTCPIRSTSVTRNGHRCRSPSSDGGSSVSFVDAARPWAASRSRRTRRRYAPGGQSGRGGSRRCRPRSSRPRRPSATNADRLRVPRSCSPRSRCRLRRPQGTALVAQRGRRRLDRGRQRVDRPRRRRAPRSGKGLDGYSKAAQGRAASTKLTLAPPPIDGDRRIWPLRATDVDRMGQSTTRPTGPRWSSGWRRSGSIRDGRSRVSRLPASDRPRRAGRARRARRGRELPRRVSRRRRSQGRRARRGDLAAALGKPPSGSQRSLRQSLYRHVRMNDDTTEQRADALSRRGALTKLGGLAVALGGSALGARELLDADDADAAGTGPAAVASGLVSCVLAPSRRGPCYLGRPAAIGATSRRGRPGVALALWPFVKVGSSRTKIKGAAVESLAVPTPSDLMHDRHDTGMFLRGLSERTPRGTRDLQDHLPRLVPREGTASTRWRTSAGTSCHGSCTSRTR